MRIRTAAVGGIAALLAASTALAVTPVGAQTGELSYICHTESAAGDLEFQVTGDTNAPKKLYVGKSVTPRLTRATVVEAGTVNLARLAGARSVDGHILSTVTLNGAARQIKGTVPRTDLPASGDLPVSASGPMPKLTAAKVGSMTYKPGDIAVTLTFYDQSGDEALAVEDAPCDLESAPTVIDKVAFLKSPTKVAESASYSKAKKKATATARISSTSKVGAVGKVTFKLYRGKKRLKTRTVTVRKGKASTSFPGVRAKGGYKITARYGGSKALKPSSASRTFRVR